MYYNGSIIYDYIVHCGVVAKPTTPNIEEASSNPARSFSPVK